MTNENEKRTREEWTLDRILKISQKLPTEEDRAEIESLIEWMRDLLANKKAKEKPSKK